MATSRGRRRKLPTPGAQDPFADERGLAKRKLRQLCRQVERALVTAIADDRRETVRGLLVDTVLPWPNAARLLVAVRPSDPSADVDREAILGALGDAKADLREVVAGAVHRKRVPDLCFEIFSSETDEVLDLIPER